LSSALSQAPALVVLVYGESRQDHDRRRMPGQALHNARRSILWINATDGQAIEAHHLAAPATHIGLRAMSFLADERITLQELVECRLPTTNASTESSAESLRTGS